MQLAGGSGAAGSHAAYPAGRLSGVHPQLGQQSVHGQRGPSLLLCVSTKVERRGAIDVEDADGQSRADSSNFAQQIGPAF